jgi:hypothetical protein
MQMFSITAMIVLYAVLSVSAQGPGGGGGGGGGPPIGAGSDTVYYKSTYFGAAEKINSITDFNLDGTAKKYSVYYLNGSLNYYGLYDYLSGKITRETYYNASNQITFYGTYSSNSYGGKDFKYYDKNNVLLWEAQYDSAKSAIDSSWQCRKYTVYTASSHIRYWVTYEYNSSGWLTKEKYFDHNNDSLGVGIWGWDPLSQQTVYTYKCKNKYRLYNSIADLWYNQYRYYYHGTVKLADSLKVYSNDTLLYTARFEYDTYGWMLKDRYFNKAGQPVFHGEYSFDKPTLVKTYRYSKEPDSLLFETKFDYRDYYLTTSYYKTGQVASIVKYEYNQAGFYSKLTRTSPQAALMGTETYSFYEPYYWLQRDSGYDAANKLLFYYNYDEYGNITDSMRNTMTHSRGEKARITPLVYISANNTIVLRLFGNGPVRLEFIDPAGRQAVTFKDNLTQGIHSIAFPAGMRNRAAGCYLYRATVNGQVFSGKLSRFR